MKYIGKILGLFIHIVFSFLDLLIFIIIFPVYFLAAFLYFRLFKNNNIKLPRSALFLPSMGSTSDVMNKFGSLDILKDHNIDGFFQRLYIAFFPTRENVKLCIDNAILVYDFKMVKEFKCLSGLLYLHGLVKILNRERVSFVRAMSPYAIGFIGRVVSWISSVPFCVSIHEDSDRRYLLLRKGGERMIFGSRPLAKMLEKFIYKTADTILPIRESLRDKIIEYGVNKDKIHLIPHGVEVELFDDIDEEFRQKINPSSKALIVSVCRHSMDNYIFDCLEAAELLLKKRNDFIFIMVGDGAIHKEAEKRIRDNNLSDFVKLPGYLSHDDAIKYWMACDIAVCLMGGYSIIEAALARKPIISYDVEWHSELVINGKTGFLIKERDINSVAESLYILVNNAALRREYGMNARKIAEENYSKKRADAIKIDRYKKILGEI